MTCFSRFDCFFLFMCLFTFLSFWTLYDIEFFLYCLCYKQQPEESSWIEPKVVPACMITSLATIKFSKCEGIKGYIKFLEYMLANAEILKKVTIIWDKLSIEEETRLCTQLLNAPRASQCCEIYFLGYRSLSTGS